MSHSTHNIKYTLPVNTNFLQKSINWIGMKSQQVEALNSYTMDHKVKIWATICLKKPVKILPISCSQ